MKKTFSDHILKAGAILLVLFILLMLTPRVVSFIDPSGPPVGYHFKTLDLLAVGIGIERLVNSEPALPLEIEEIKDIEYKNINGISLKLDLYKPKDIKEARPLIVFFHGGGWRSGRRSDYRIYLIPLAMQGYVTATVSYRLIKNALYPACIEDVTDAVAWLYSNSALYGYDTGRIALAGGSAGAHLAMMTGYGWRKRDTDTTSGRKRYNIKCIVDIYGPVDLTTEYARNHRLVKDFMGSSWEENPGIYREASPLTWLSRSSPPTLILHGTSDKLVPISQSEMLEQRLKSLNVPVEFYRLPLWPHTMDIVMRVNDYCQNRMEEFFRKYL